MKIDPSTDEWVRFYVERERYAFLFLCLFLTNIIILQSQRLKGSLYFPLVLGSWFNQLNLVAGDLLMLFGVGCHCCCL